MVVFLSSISILFLLFNQIFSQLGSSLLDRFTLESLTGLVDGGSGRIDIWLASIQGIFTKPFFGFGTGNAIFVNSIYLNKPFGAHNFYLTSLIEIGFFGTTIIFILFSYIFIKLLRLRNFLLFCIFISYAVVLLFLDATSAKFFWSTLTLIQIGISSNNLSNNKSRANKYAY
jgi:O-antigen ligase